MFAHKTLVVATAALLAVQCASLPAHADNAMGYRLLSAQDATQLPHNHGVLGLRIERAQHISDHGLSFDIIRIMDVPGGSPGARAGFKVGDQIIAVDGQVFASIAAFGGYIGSIPPGGQIQVDYMPQGGGPQQAQRASVVVGGGPTGAPTGERGLSTTSKIAIGAGAIALFGCYEMGCFSHHHATGSQPGTPPPTPAPGVVAAPTVPNQ